MAAGAAKFLSFLRSNAFFYVIIGFFIIQALWIAFSAAYPQAFDENFHFGIIQVYSHHWLPFLRSQPPNADPFGAVARDPSYLYHYLMSFPYRLIAHFWHTVAEQVIALRLINVALFASGLLLFRRVLKRLALPAGVINLCLFIVSFIPVAPQLAGQINYDNLLLPLVAWSCLALFTVIDELRRREINSYSILKLLTICLFSSLVKYEFMPIFLAIVLFVAIYGSRQLQGHWKPSLQASKQQLLVRTNWLARSIWAVALVAALGLFAQRDIGNVVMYHTFVPDCSQVLEIQHCSAYSVWIHDHLSHQAVVNRTVHVNKNPVAYLGEWIYWLWYRLFFVVNGPLQNFRNYPPLPLPAAAFGLLVIGGVLSIAKSSKRIFRAQPYYVAIAMITIVYLLALLAEGYLKYRSTGVLELMNGRYLFPVILLGAALASRSLLYMTADRQTVRLWLSIGIIICFLEGGGVISFISRSNQSWDWHNHIVQTVNDDARKLLGPIIIDGPSTYSTHKWFFN